MELCTMEFLEPKDEKEKKIYEAMNSYIQQLADACKTIQEFGNRTINQIPLMGTESKVQCSNYPLMDEVETDDICYLEIHHWTPDEVKSIERTIRRSELDYSGKSLNEVKEDHLTDKMRQQYLTDIQTTQSNSLARIIDIISETYYEYMTRMGYLSREGTPPLNFISHCLNQLSMASIQEVGFAFLKGGYSITKRTAKNICIIFGNDPNTITQITAPFCENAITNGTRFMIMSKKEFEEEIMEGVIVNSDSYELVSKKFKFSLALLSVFTYDTETRVFTQVDLERYVKKVYVDLCDVVSKQLDPMTGHIVNMMRVPGYSDEYFGVLWRDTPITLTSKENYVGKTKLIVSNKVKVTDIRFVDERGCEIDSNYCKLHDFRQIKENTDHLTGVSNIYEIEFEARKNCYIKIVCDAAWTENKPFDSIDAETCPILELTYSDYRPLVSFDDIGNPKRDRLTPMISSINIPFCKNIKELKLKPDWAICGKLDDLMKLYVVDHVSASNPKEVTKRLINFNISNIMFVQGMKDSDKKLQITDGVGWCPSNKTPHSPCISLDHQGQWFLHIDLLEPIPVLTCRMLQFSLMDNSILVTSNRGVSYAPAQDICFHVIPVETIKKRYQDCCYTKYGIKVTPEHPINYPVILGEDRCDFAVTKNKYRESIFSSTYTFTMRPVLKNQVIGDDLYGFEPFRKYEYTDSIYIFYKKTNHIEPPVAYSVPRDIRFVDGTLGVDLEIDDDVKKNIKDYTFYIFIRYMLLKNKNTNAMWLVKNKKFIFDMKK